MVLKVKYAIEGDTNVPGVYLDGRITEPSLEQKGTAKEV